MTLLLSSRTYSGIWMAMLVCSGLEQICVACEVPGSLASKVLKISVYSTITVLTIAVTLSVPGQSSVHWN